MADTTSAHHSPPTDLTHDERRRLNAAETDRRLADGEADQEAARLDAEAHEARAAGDTARSPFYGDA